MTRDEVIAGLREAADFIERHPDVPVEVADYQLVLAQAYVGGAEELAAVARALGKAEKDVTDSFAGVSRVVGLVKFGAFAMRSQVCERVVTGTRTVERPVIEEIGIETVEEEVVEWRCPDSLLGATR